MDVGVEVKKVDSQGRLIIPADWRKSELRGVKEVYVIKRKSYLKVVPKRKVDLTKLFDKVDLGVDAIGEWGSSRGPLLREVDEVLRRKRSRLRLL